jgi:hypothetical protein
LRPITPPDGSHPPPTPAQTTVVKSGLFDGFEHFSN